MIKMALGIEPAPCTRIHDSTTQTARPPPRFVVAAMYICAKHHFDRTSHTPVIDRSGSDVARRRAGETRCNATERACSLQSASSASAFRLEARVTRSTAVRSTAENRGKTAVAVPKLV